ncbi:unnamed protein product, partial [Mesorhabditis belari]|uniref:Carbonic anhydrase n=1 Tax=Mesorhabditis belari TaxID=2138241 RepID=A0AAF3FGC3_9BILA
MRKAKKSVPKRGVVKKKKISKENDKKEIKSQKSTKRESSESSQVFGKRQSPIDIVSKNVKIDAKLRKNGGLRIDAKNCHFNLSITECGWRADVDEGTSVALLAPHLIGDFSLEQFHAHWSSDSKCGSEHTVDGKSFAAELHFVFWATKYESFAEAAQQSDGLAVVGVFIEESNKSIPKLFANSIQEAREAGKPIAFSLDLGKLLPSRSTFCTYPGSLTTCPYSESVTWNLFKEAIRISKQELGIWRQISPSNYRECQKMNGRKVLSSEKF